MPERRDEIMEVVMTLIMHGGDARSSAMEAIHAAKDNDYERAQKKLDGADESISQAHKVQTDLLSQEASGENVEINLLLVHAEDHLMNAMTYRDLAGEMIELYKRIN
ncbi:PTS system, cellobiose-specific IIA component [Alkalibacterium subtropicum]|uniref:PTS system, cellobiose-specific IIA component n=1 Tax=Alkalibacterium subtropicum TaxID=753702 RepID=A0A1I1GLR7_9LACT|nr:PTS lactose/cellobiose transporter subunit IIA [Alkalibacterium subtropicum]SFC12441.1 PTS system, cellobiose-specific IIA component [Alkalibacterium subtropicum]